MRTGAQLRHHIRVHDHFLLSQCTISLNSSSFDPVSSPSKHLLKITFFDIVFYFRFDMRFDRFSNNRLISYAIHLSFLKPGTHKTGFPTFRTISQVAPVIAPFSFSFQNFLTALALPHSGAGDKRIKELLKLYLVALEPY